jgi:TRAP transporter 4TM/12TM fusion protein
LTSRQIARPRLEIATVIYAVHVVFALSFVYFHFLYPLGPREEAIFFMGAVLAMTFVLRPSVSPWPRLAWTFVVLDALLIGGAIASAAYLIFNWDVISGRAGAPARFWDITMAVVCVGVTLEATRRVMPVLVPVALVFLAYVWLGQYFSGYLAPPRISVSRMTQVLYLSNNGLWGSGLRAGFQYIMPFLILGALLKAVGVMDVITEVVLRLLRGTIGAGAKLAVIGSAFFGMLSGSSVANVAFSGTFSIPLMRRNGFSREFSAAVEAGASTAGSLTPPVMGLAAFVMVEFTGISYARIALAAAIPAAIYYIALFTNVHLKARELKATGKLVEVMDEIPEGAGTAALDWWSLTARTIPIFGILAFLIYAIVEFTPSRAAFYTVLLVVPLSFVMGRANWLTPARIGDALVDASRGFIFIGAALICAGIMLGVVSATGVALKISEIMRGLSGGSQILLLLLAAINLIVLGMGLGGVVVYIIGAIMLAPAMITLGIDQLSAHFFIFYIAQLITLVPPVCMTIYAAISIAGSKTGPTIIETLRITAFVFVLPFVSVLHPELLFVGSPLDVVSSAIVATAAAVFLVFATNRVLCGPLGILPRAVFGLCSAVLIVVGNDNLMLATLALSVGVALTVLRRVRQPALAAQAAPGRSLGVDPGANVSRNRP